MRNTELSPREEELVFLAGKGLTDVEMATRLGIRPNTVAAHWKRMRLKLGAASRTEVAAVCAEKKAAQLVKEHDALQDEIARRLRAEERLLKARAALEELVRIQAAELQSPADPAEDEAAARVRFRDELLATWDRLAAAVDYTGAALAREE